MKYVLIVVFLSIVSFQAAAQEPDNSGATRIEVDQDAHVIRFFVQGEEVAQFSSGGLIVPGTVAYGGVVMDVGQEGAKDLMNTSGATDAQDDGAE